MQGWYKCPKCGQDILYGTDPCPYCKCSLAWSQQGPIPYIPPIEEPQQVIQPETSAQQPIAVSKPKKIIRETKYTCQVCGKIWYFGKADALETAGNALGNLGKSMMCCGGCLPAIFIPDKKVVDPSKCPECGSRVVTKWVVNHEV